MDAEAIDKFIELFNDELIIIPNRKVYLRSYNYRYKKYLENQGFEVVLVDDLPENVELIYGNLDDKE